LKGILKITAAFCLLLVSCAPKTAKETEPRHLSDIKVPSVYTSPEEKVDYILSHYWDELLNGSGITDSSFILGVPKEEVEQKVSNYIGVLRQVGMGDAQKSVARMFSKLEAAQQADTLSGVFKRFSEVVSRYMYDPNSPMRNEDYYLPFVRGLAASAFTEESMRPAYAHDAKMCSLNQFGEKVPDFAFRTLKGKTLRLYGIKAEYTMLFFSNPGCHACKGIIDEVMARPYVEGMMAAGKLAVINVYIDEQIDEWKAYAPTYPESWYSGYDPEYIIRQDLLYNVRAIPSLYLLDSEKRVIMKDAPTENVLAFMDNIAKTE